MENSSGTERERRLESQKPVGRSKVTNDFVHFIVHQMANASGEPCNFCFGSFPIKYA